MEILHIVERCETSSGGDLHLLRTNCSKMLPLQRSCQSDGVFFGHSTGESLCFWVIPFYGMAEASTFMRSAAKSPLFGSFEMGPAEGCFGIVRLCSNQST